MANFTAIFTDGFRVVQDDKDISNFTPTKSQYYDVMVHMEVSRLAYFYIDFPDIQWGVNLHNGRFWFKIGEIIHEFQVEPGMSPMNIPGPFELIYFKDHKADIVFGGIPSQTIETKYRIGWKSGRFTQTIIVG